MPQKLVFAKFAISLLRHMPTSATLIALRRKSFNCRTTVKILIHIKYVKNANRLGILNATILLIS